MGHNLSETLRSSAHYIEVVCTPALKLLEIKHVVLT